jgi:hypothetical protein
MVGIDWSSSAFAWSYVSWCRGVSVVHRLRWVTPISLIYEVVTTSEERYNRRFARLTGLGSVL